MCKLSVLIVIEFLVVGEKKRLSSGKQHFYLYLRKAAYLISIHWHEMLNLQVLKWKLDLFFC